MGGFWDVYGMFGEKHPMGNKLKNKELRIKWEDFANIAYQNAQMRMSFHLNEAVIPLK